MEELSNEQNIFPSDFPNDNMNYNNYSNNLELINNQELDNDAGELNINQDIIKSKDKLINQLKRKIKVYEKNTEDQNLKLSKYDHILVEYESLNKNYSKLMEDNELLRTENTQLKDILNSKNQTILDFQGLFEASKSKFELFSQTNNSLKTKIAELESKLKMYPDMVKNNENLNQKMAEYESRIQEIKDEFNKREEFYKVKLINREKMNQNNSKANEEEINELKNEVNKLKKQLEMTKKKNEELLSNKRLSEEQFNNKLLSKEKENEQLMVTINNLQLNINDNNLLSKTEVNNQKNELQKLKNEIKNLQKELSDKEEQNNNLANALNDANNAINQTDIEIETRNSTINGLIEEKDQLIKQLNEKQNDFNEYQNSSQQEIEMLNQKYLAIEEERENLINSVDILNQEINQLKGELYQYESNGNIYLEEKNESENKINNLAHSFQIKEEEYLMEIEKMEKINQKLKKEIDNLKAKFEQKINLLILQNNEANTRVKKLINTCISLKNYALSIERNINMNNTLYRGNGGNQNYGGNYLKTKDLLSSMNNIINNIDPKMLNDNLNQTF